MKYYLLTFLTIFTILIVSVICLNLNHNNENKKYDNYDNSLFIIENFYKEKDFINIRENLKNFNKLYNDERIPSRKTICFKDKKKHQNLYRLIYNSSLKKFIKKLDKRKMILPSFPIEYRKYENKSIGMNWHKDLALYSGEYFEAVLTIDNYSDSNFEFIYNNKNYIIKTQPNMLILVKPNTIIHRVTPLNRGFRTILKYVITFNDNKETSVFQENFDKCPF